MDKLTDLMPHLFFVIERIALVPVVTKKGAYLALASPAVTIV
jgi:hypothetical protein